MPITHNNGIEREMTTDEIAEHDLTLADAMQRREAAEAAAEAAAAAKQSARAKLKLLGLTDAEIAALVG